MLKCNPLCIKLQKLRIDKGDRETKVTLNFTADWYFPELELACTNKKVASPPKYSSHL